MNPNWSTPQTLFDNLNKQYEFWIDLASNDDNYKTDLYLTKENDSLKYNWHNLKIAYNGLYKCNNSGIGEKYNFKSTQFAWLNPPYGKELKHWVEKSYQEHLLGFKVLLLIPAYTDVKYFHDYIFDKANEIIFIKGRLSFGCPEYSQLTTARFSSMLVGYHGYKTNHTNFKMCDKNGILI